MEIAELKAQIEDAQNFLEEKERESEEIRAFIPVLQQKVRRSCGSRVVIVVVVVVVVGGGGIDCQVGLFTSTVLL